MPSVSNTFALPGIEPRPFGTLTDDATHLAIQPPSVAVLIDILTNVDGCLCMCSVSYICAADVAAWPTGSRADVVSSATTATHSLPSPAE